MGGTCQTIKVMEPVVTGRKEPLRALLVALVLSLPNWTSGADDSIDTRHTRDPADKEACQAKLNLIFEAIREYRKQHQDELPEKLSDLMPEFIHDPKVLICPFVQKTGGLRWWRKKIRELSFDPRTSYGYEFTPNKIEYDLWRGLPRKTWRDFKSCQMEKLGKFGRAGVVPIVRCHVHEPKLNLAFDGQIYESGLYWEYNYTNLVSFEDLDICEIFADPAAKKKLSIADFPTRDPHAPPRLLDLSEQYNGLLTDSWQGFPGNHLAELHTGVEKYAEVPFDVRGVIQLRGLDFPFRFPEKVEGIRVNQKCSRIHFLHGTAFGAHPGTNVACYFIHYTDNQVREAPIVYGQQIADWWVDPKHPVELTDAKVAWTGQNEAAEAYGKSLRLYRFTWENPLKEVGVASISFVSGASTSAPFLIAITIEP